MTPDATVLIVDDEPAVLSGLRRALHTEPWDVLGATSADEALRIIEERDVDVVVSDQDMPGTRGTSLLAAVRERAPDVVRLMLTGQATLATAVDAINAGGVTEFLLKPVDGPTLIAAIRRAMRDRLLHLAAHSAQALLLVDPQTRLVLHASAAAERLLGAEPLKGRDVRDVLTSFGTCAAAEVDHRLDTADGQSWRMRRHGEPPVEAEVRVWAPTAVDRVVWVTLDDITEQMRLERQVIDLQKSELAGQVAAGVLHDLNNLLTVIDTRSHLLARDRDGGIHMLQNAEAIQTTVKHAGALSRQLMRFLRTGEIETEPVDVNAMLLDLGGLLPRVLHADVRLESILAADLAPVEANRLQLEQVVLNLVVNARDAMPDGGRLIVRTTMIDTAPAGSGLPAGPYVLLEVTDSGAGMTDEVRRRLFEPFFTTKGDHGTGLGLPTVAAIVRHHKGHIEVASEPGRGSTFCVYLPGKPNGPAPPARP